MVESPGSQLPASVLAGCLVDGDPEFERRAGKIKRRALAASIVLQIVVVAALVLVPLLSKGESIATYSYTPVPPYHRGTVAEHRAHTSRPASGRPNQCRFCAPTRIPPHVVTVDHTSTSNRPEPGAPDIPGSSEGQNIPGSLDVFTTDRGPDRPREIEQGTPRTIKVSAGVEAARLVHRVEPIYPPLPKAIHKEGRVALRAVISTDGRIKSLEVVSGDPMFITSALSAVAEWRYQATLLNNEPVEVETYITVIYTLSR